MSEKFPYFSYDPEGDGFDTHATAEEAKAVAEKAIDESLDDGWSERVDEICWGEIRQQSCVCDRQVKPSKEELAKMDEDERWEVAQKFGEYDELENHRLFDVLPDHAAALAERDRRIIELTTERDLALAREADCEKHMEYNAELVRERDQRIAELEKTNAGLHEIQDDQRTIIADLRARLAVTKDAVKALEGLMRINGFLWYEDGEYKVKIMPTCWDAERTFCAPNPLVAVNAALAAKEEK